jgi:hypothetical protein
MLCLDRHNAGRAEPKAQDNVQPEDAGNESANPGWRNGLHGG